MVFLSKIMARLKQFLREMYKHELDKESHPRIIHITYRGSVSICVVGTIASMIKDFKIAYLEGLLNFCIAFAPSGLKEGNIDK